MIGDIAIARRTFPPIPKINETCLGFEYWGVIHELGPGVTEFEVGDVVAGEPVNGTLTDYYIGNIDRVYKINGPGASIDPIYGAALPVSYMTAFVMAEDIKSYGPFGGKTDDLHVFVGGASGAVGCALVQFCKLYGWTVYATCSQAKADLVKSLGADHIYDYKNKKWTDQLKADLAGRKLDAAATAHSKSDAKKVWKLVNKPGLHLVYGFYDEALNYGMLRLIPVIIGRILAIKIGGLFSSGGKKQRMVSVDDENAKQQARYRVDIQTLADMVASGKLKPVISKCYTLEETKEAFADVAEGRNRGKTIVAVGVEARIPN